MPVYLPLVHKSWHLVKISKFTQGQERYRPSASAPGVSMKFPLWWSFTLCPPHTQPPLHPTGLVPELQKDQIRAASKALLLLRLRSEGKQMKDGKIWVAKWFGGVQASTEMLFHGQKMWLMIAAPFWSGKLCRQTSCATQTALSPSSST